MPRLECRECGYRKRAGISDGLKYLADSSYQVKCPKCGKNMWAEDPEGKWKARAEEERRKRGIEDAAAAAAPQPTTEESEPPSVGTAAAEEVGAQQGIAEPEPEPALACTS
jgi:hypothetical protein